jgi:2,3-bisphosphoglycerate-independent phosphoglycerate mutase
MSMADGNEGGAVEVLVIPDGAAEDPDLGPTSLERASTPILDRLCREGRVASRRTIPAGLPAGSEVGVSTLLGAVLDEAPSRSWIEAAAAAIEVPPGTEPHRVDLYRDGLRCEADDPALVAAGLAASSQGPAFPLAGHRYLVLGPVEPLPPEGCRLRIWPTGPRLEPVLDQTTVLIGASGGAVGAARLMGARTITPPGATGRSRTDCAAKAVAALAELDRARWVVVHVAAPDEASHERDPAAKVAALEAIDRDILAPLSGAVAALGGTITVSPDHGTDPRDGEHLAEPVPSVVWGAGIAPSGPDRMLERLVRG